MYNRTYRCGYFARQLYRNDRRRNDNQEMESENQGNDPIQHNRRNPCLTNNSVFLMFMWSSRPCRGH